MLQRPDPQSFTRFVASIGLFLCVLAVVGVVGEGAAAVVSQELVRSGVSSELSDDEDDNDDSGVDERPDTATSALVGDVD